MNYKPREVTQDELDFLYRNDFIWIDGWNFTYNGEVYDLSAADIFQIDEIKARGLFKVQS